MKNSDNERLLANKRAYDEARRAKAIDRDKQARLRDMTPGTATPASVMRRRALDTYKEKGQR